MKIRLLFALVGLAISFALPTFAQQKETVDPQTTQKMLAIGKAYDEGENANDADAIAALFTEDAVFVTDRGQSTVGKPLRNCIQTCTRDGTPKTTSPRSMGMLFT